MTKEDFTLGMKTERMTDIALAFRQTGAILAAIKLELFTHIANGAGTVDEIAGALGIDAEKADRLLTVCKSMDLVRVVDGRHENYSDVQRYLAKDSRTYFGDYLDYMAHRDYSAWEYMAENLTAVATDNEDDDRTYLRLMQDPKQARDFTEAGYEASIGLGHKLAKEFDFSKFKRWLDLGGGSGCYAIAACERQDGFSPASSSRSMGWVIASTRRRAISSAHPIRQVSTLRPTSRRCRAICPTRLLPRWPRPAMRWNRAVRFWSSTTC